MRLKDFYHNKLWFSGKLFSSIEDANNFLKENSDFGLLTERPSRDKSKLFYIVARNEDKGSPVLDLYYDGEDSGFCQTYYRSKNGSLYVKIPHGLYTCNDDDWREPDCPVREELFKLIERPK